MTHTNENKTNIEEPFQQLDMKFADTEAGNRDRFVALNKGKCLYIKELKTWTVWDGTRWKKTGLDKINKLADETAKSIQRQVQMSLGLLPYACVFVVQIAEGAATPQQQAAWPCLRLLWC